MFFDNEQLAFRVIDVLSIDSRNFHKENRNRHFCALSFRIETDAKIRYRGRELVMQANSITFFPADVDYYREASVDKMLVIHFEVFNHAFSEIETFITSRPEEVGDQFSALYSEWMKNRPDRHYRATSMMYTIIAGLYTENLQQTQGHSQLLIQALRYISRHFTETTLSVPEVTKQIGISESYLRRLFQHELQTSPKQFLLYQRLQHAASLLDSGYFSVAEVAHKAGFSDEKYFSSTFKKFFGCSPSKYCYRFIDDT